MDHIKWGGAGGMMPGWDDRRTTGNRPNGILVPRFRNVSAATKQTFARGYQFQGGAGRDDWGGGWREPGIGAGYKARLSRLGPWYMSFGGYGECLPNDENRATLDETLKDKWGIPTLHISAAWSNNEIAMHRDMSDAAAEMLEAAGARNIEKRSTHSTMGNANHEMGGARMGRDPATSVLDSFNQAHEVKGLFVTDGSCMASSGCVNPSLTYMALTARAVDHAVTLMNRREL
jgi:choline dehydrogenase-like flavoprotein